jgi:formate hydrogenlyase transcriptional activator
MPVRSDFGSAGTYGKYQALLELSSAITTQPNASGMLQSLRQHLSKVLDLDGVIFIKLEKDGKTGRLLALGQVPAVSGVEIGARIRLEGSAVGKALAQMKPVFVSDLNQEMLGVPALASQASVGLNRCAYVFPLATPRVCLGALLYASAGGKKFNDDDAELMASASAQVATALEGGMATDAAESYRQQLEEERDRLGLLLDINNQIIAKHEVRELFRSASMTIRKYFDNDFAGFWLQDGESHQFECAVLDFPALKGSAESIPGVELAGSAVQRMGDRIPHLSTEQDIDDLPGPVSDVLRAESIKCLVSAPLVTTQGPVGMIALGSRRPHDFTQADADLLLQVGNQIALALDSAIAYGRLDAFKDRLQTDKLYLESEIRSECSFEDIVGNSPALRRVLDQVAVVAPTRSTVLLHGETGTGKELIARAIHTSSPRRERTFVKLNCAAIPAALVESELFGHEKGAFTGAYAQKLGRFEIADRGTLFLDEIGDIALELQPKLLRALQEQEFERVGSARTIRVDVRMIAATHQDLPSMIRENRFREDLFYRLNVFPIEVPPLRDRREDIPLLVHYFVSRLSREMQKHIRTIPREAMNALTNAPWPGNIRELGNFIERAVILTKGDELNVPVRELARSPRVGTNSTAVTATTLRESERKAIIDALAASAGKVAGPQGAAERLGLKRSTLRNKMRRLNIGKADY